ncbi:MAG TPA: CBS domain-containing protein [Candidatus Limnocylindria bacterium]|nr:CBS domain-containing protein [Candidatus Limnocylindria bacterium]
MNSNSEPLTVAQLMTPEPIVVGEGAEVESAVRLLEEHEVSGLPVVDEDGLLVGVISQSDVVRARAVPHLWSRWHGLRVRHLMHAPVLTADGSMTIEEAAQLMESAHVHRLVVVGEDQLRPVGIVSTSDLVRALAHRPTDA